MTSRLIAVVLLAPLFSNHPPCAAQSSTPSPVLFHYLNATTTGESSALSGECDGTTASPEITCRVTQVIVRYQLDPKDTPAEINKRIARLRAEAGKDPKKLTDQMCAEVRKSRADVERKLQDVRNPRTKRQAQDFLALCANPSMAALEDWMRRTTLAESRTCKVSVFQNDPVTYKKVGPNKWVANVGPQGICSAVLLYTMENDPKHSSLWKWSQVRTYADTSQELCKNVQLNYKLEYSWQGDDPDITCDSISFGL